MKKILFLFTLSFLVLMSCKNETSTTTAEVPQPSVPASTTTAANPTATPSEPAVPAGPITNIKFDQTEFDFGTVMEGEKVVHVYKFTNTGNEPLIISNAKGSCGCTVPQWPREPIAPGEKGEIKVQFDTKNKGKVGGGLQSKRVTITANTDPVNSYLTIKGKVDKEEAPANPS